MSRKQTKIVSRFWVDNDDQLDEEVEGVTTIVEGHFIEKETYYVPIQDKELDGSVNSPNGSFRIFKKSGILFDSPRLAVLDAIVNHKKKVEDGKIFLNKMQNSLERIECIYKGL